MQNAWALADRYGLFNLSTWTAHALRRWTHTPWLPPLQPGSEARKRPSHRSELPGGVLGPWCGHVDCDKLSGVLWTAERDFGLLTGNVRLTDCHHMFQLTHTHIIFALLINTQLSPAMFALIFFLCILKQLTRKGGGKQQTLQKLHQFHRKVFFRFSEKEWMC